MFLNKCDFYMFLCFLTYIHRSISKSLIVQLLLKLLAMNVSLYSCLVRSILVSVRYNCSFASVCSLSPPDKLQ